VIDIAPGYIQNDLNADSMAPAGRYGLTWTSEFRDASRARRPMWAHLWPPCTPLPVPSSPAKPIYIDGAQGIAH